MRLVEPDARGRSSAPRRPRPLAALLGISALLGLVVAGALIVVVEGGVPEVDPGPGAAPADEAHTVVVVTEPEGARVYGVDEGSAPQDAPARYALKPGETLEVVVRAPGYVPHRERLAPDPEVDPRVVRVRLDPEPVPLLVEVRPEEAKVTVDGAPYRPGMRVRPGKLLEVRARAEGFLEAERTVTAEVGEPLEVQIALDARPVVEKAEATKERPRIKKTRRKSARPAPRSPPPEELEPGTLVLSTSPVWAEVILDGKRLKQSTPLRLKVSPGRHEVVLRHPPKGLEKRITVTVRPGEVVRRDVSF